MQAQVERSRYNSHKIVQIYKQTSEKNEACFFFFTASAVYIRICFKNSKNSREKGRKLGNNANRW